ncbi:MAG: hypothetical protein AAGD25_06460 [Cyanobacteria bacterium P01_F01_bin.150]
MIINLTQHKATPQQIAAGVIESQPESKRSIKALLLFEELPSKEEIQHRASALAAIAFSHKASSAMIGGAPYLMSELEKSLAKEGIKAVYSFSERVSEEVMDHETGEVRKVNKFSHIGFVDAVN